ncbi:MAG: alpha-glucosidase/alpha-galactosidase, partial [Tenericutes bacterium HGW-Tenericutes-8]
KYGIYQSVGDTTGPAGVMRSLIVMPIFFEFAKMIEKYAPNAWVINFTNPMTMCLQSLYEGFPKIKAYGNCHEVFGSQKDLAEIYNTFVKKDVATREDVHIDVSGINHFTWINQMSCFGQDLMPLYDQHVKTYGKLKGKHDKEDYHVGYPFTSESQVKYDLYKRYGSMAAAGDRHLAEFMPKSLYLKDLNTIAKYKFHLTPIQWRKDRLVEQEKKIRLLIEEKEPLKITSSGEEGIRQIKALLGMETLITNVNHLNLGQAQGLPLGQVVETNAVFRYDSLTPTIAKKLPIKVEKMVKRLMKNHQLLMKSFQTKDLKYAFQALVNDPLCNTVDKNELNKMFKEMVDLLNPHLDIYMR